MKLFFLILNWAAGALFLLLGLMSIFKSFMAAIFLLLISLVFIPPARNFIYEKTGRALAAKEKTVLVFVLLIGFTTFAVMEQEEAKKEQLARAEQHQVEELARLKAENIQYYKDNKITIIEKINAAINEKKYGKAVAIINRYAGANDSELKALKAKPRTEQLKEKLKNTKKKNYIAQRKIYGQLSKLNSDNQDYLAKFNSYSKKAAAQEKAERIAKEKKEKAARLAKARKTKIDVQFSPWDGSHRALEKVIKRSMNDPDSYDHVETKYWDMKTYLVVSTTFRGRNAFGGVVKDYVKAKVSLDGVVLKTFK